MSIPKLTADLAVIQKLADLPNSTDGLSAQELKAKFDQAGLAIQSWINETLQPALVATQLPFAPTSAISASTIQDAVEAVQGQIRDAATGTIVNGSVTKEKLAAALLARVYGGRVWVSLDEPDSGDNPQADFPVGQIWLRPGFTVANAAKEGWICVGCQISQGVLAGNQTAAVAKAAQIYLDLGQEGDRVMILFGIKDKNPEISQITLALNGGAAQDASAGVFETTLPADGALEMWFTTTWPSASLALDGWTLDGFTVVNLDAIARQNPDAAEMTDWETYLDALRPFTEHVEQDAVFVQVRSGQWWQVLDRAEADGGYLRYAGGRAVWTQKEQVVQDLGVLRVMTGSYTGTGNDRTVELPVTPKLLVVAPVGGPADGYYRLYDNPEILTGGAKVSREVEVGNTVPTVSVELEGNSLQYSGGNGYAVLLNRPNVTYNWTALY